MKKKSCQQNSSICTNNTCLNGGTCFKSPVTNITKCTCPALFTGKNCELNFNPCSNTLNPVCQNFGACIVIANQYPYYQCICSDGYFGPNCEISSSTTLLIRTTTSRIISSSSSSSSTITSCLDKSLSCSYYAAHNFCKAYYFLNGISILQYCAKSCNMCSTNLSTKAPIPCVDKEYSCVIWGALRYCNELPDPFVCRKSCNLC